MPRAKFVVFEPQRELFFAVYPGEVRPAEVEHVVKGVAAIAGVTAKILRTAVPELKGEATIVEMHVALRNRPPALRVFKRLTNPELPIAISQMRVELFRCSCGLLGAGLTGLQFIQAFEPVNKQSFMVGLRTMIQGTNFSKALQQHPGAPYRGVTSTVRRLLRGLSAHAAHSNIEVLQSNERRRCTHQG